MLASVQLPTGISVPGLLVSSVEAAGTQAAEKGRKSTTFQEHGETSLMPERQCAIVRKMWLWSWRDQVLCLKFTSHMILVKIFHFSVPQFTYLENKGNTALCDKKTVFQKLMDRLLHGDMECEL